MVAKIEKKRTKKKPQSAELAGGAGFTFEDAVAAYYLAALLAEGYAPGIENRVVSRVAVQQRHFKQPLDDVVVDFSDTNGEPARLSLQVKRELTISAAKTNTDFRDVIRDSWVTYSDTVFRHGIDRYGAAVGDVAKTKARDLAYLCEMARNSTTLDHFKARFVRGGNASVGVKVIKKDIAALLKAAKGSACSEAEVHRFLTHFVLVKFDFLHGGATNPSQALTVLRDSFASGHEGSAPLVWSKLRTIARDADAVSGEFDRPSLVRELAPVARLKAAASMRGDLDKLTALARSSIDDIQNNVGGTHINRAKLMARLEQAISVSRFVQITGLPGSGKSVLLRQCIEADLSSGGPVLFLKSDRLSGRGWAGFATTIGLSGAPLASLLTEIAATGSSTLYIDGIDRIEKEHQAILLDVLRTILKTPALSNWKVVVSLRDTGIELLRNWLAEILNAIGIGTVNVDGLNDDEAQLLATAKPALRPLLFGPAQVQAIVRRPFFAKVLHQSFPAQSGGPPFEPQSELDLIENWWKRGGYDSSGQDAIARQRALIDIGAQRARNLSQPVPLAKLANASIAVIDQMVTDGLLQHVQAGISVRFSHDIFFEWSFFYVLAERAGQWRDELQACGEPPAVARVIELLSQSAYKAGTNWTATLQGTSLAKMRSQWTRAWLLGPLSHPFIEQHEAQFESAVSANNCQLLKKALVWFQAEKTTPNLSILIRDLPNDQRIRAADYWAWPSDIPTWRCLINFVLPRIDIVPAALFPDVVSIFEVWQNRARDIKNATSHAILSLCATWLREIDVRSDRDKPPPKSRWDDMSDMGTFRRSLTDLILGATGVRPELAEEYLTRLIARDRIRDERFKEVICFSQMLATTHPQLLVEFTLKHLKRELPDEQVERERKELQRNAAARKRIAAKPEAVRTRQEQMFLNHGFGYMGHSFGYHDWNHLSIDDGFQDFWPPSPLREPFHSLFAASPTHALSLVNALCNHAITAWRQLHRHVYDSPGTPVPIEIQFPWGVQQFWGGDREYLWYRRAPKAITSGFMALEDWCFTELERGRPVDELIRQIVEGNQCVGILAIAALLALHTNRISDTVFPIITTQRLWFADWNRMGQELGESSASLIGFKPYESQHIEAVRKANARPARKNSLRWLAPRYVLDTSFRERARTAILGFKDNLPFQLEEHRTNQATHDYLMKQALEYGELADLQNYYKRPTKEEGTFEVVHVSPSASRPENVARAEKATLSLQESNLWIWASKTFEEGKIEDETKVPIAIDLAKKLDGKKLFQTSTSEEEVGMRRGAVAATAALVLHFRAGRKASELKWARKVLIRAIAVQERPGTFWSPQSIIPWHQGIFVARGLAADLRHGIGNADTHFALLLLIAHPLEAVSLTALEQVASLWGTDAKLVWAALTMALQLCHLDPWPPTKPSSPSDPMHTNEKIEAVLEAAFEYSQNGKGWPALPLPPPAWVKADEKPVDPGQVADVEFEEDDVEQPTERWIEPTTHWHDQYAAKILERIPYEKICASDARDPLLSFLNGMLVWTNAKNAPPWVKKGRRDRESSRLYEWTHELGQTLGRIAGMLPLPDVKSQFLQPIFDLEGDTCWALLGPFVSLFIRAHVLDAPKVHTGTIDILQLCLERFLESPTLKRDSYRAGEFSGFDEPKLAQSLMFVEVERAMGAARFVNGDWREIGLILPLVDRFVRAAGWSASVMMGFLTLSERAKSTYPAEVFADQILAVIGDGTEPLPGWHRTFISARIAALVQHLADRDTPMPLALGQKLLRILDLLVDMGDRRSAALQLSETFREIKIT